MKKPKHFLGPTTGMAKPTTCLACGYLFEASTVIDHKTAAPKHGSIAICISCAHIMAYADDLSLRELTDAEMIEVAADPRIIAFMKARTLTLKGRKR